MAPKTEEPMNVLADDAPAVSAPEVLTASLKELSAEPVAAVVVETVETEDEPAKEATEEVDEVVEGEPVLVSDKDDEHLEETAAKAAMCSNWDLGNMMTCCGITSVFRSSKAEQEKLENEKAVQIQCAARSMLARKTAKTLKEEKEAAEAEAAAKAEAEAKAAAEAEAAAAALAALNAEAQADEQSVKRTEKKSFLQKLKSVFSGCKNAKSQVVEQPVEQAAV
jgi:hypothetical protein